MAEDIKNNRTGHAHLGYGFWLAGIMGLLAAGMLLVYFIVPRMGIGPKQPIPFSHRVHAGVKQINCRFCHSFAERGKNAGLPVVGKCFFCHKYIVPMYAPLVRERADYTQADPVAWQRIYYVPDYVQFHHQPHVRWADIQCDTCHGPVETLDRLETRHFKMGFCIDCHRELGAQTDCWLACHH